MFPYLIRFTLWLALPITLLSLLMPALGQLNPRRDWIVSMMDGNTITLHDLGRHFSAPLPIFPFTYIRDFNTQGQLAFATRSDGQAEVRVFYVRSSANPQVIYKGTTDLGFIHFNWSNDGRYLAFMELKDDESTSLYVWNGETVITINLPEPDTEIEGMLWSSRNHLAFIARPPRQRAAVPLPSELYLWDGQQTINISQTPDRDESLGMWSHDERLAYTSGGINFEDPRTVLIWDGLNSTPAFSDFSGLSWLAWNTENELTLSATDELTSKSQLYWWYGEQAVDISPDSQQSYGYQSWSRDGRWAVAMLDPMNRQMVNIQVRDANQRLLLDVAGVGHPVWTEGGSLLFCTLQPRGYELQNWDGERIWPITQGRYIYTLVPNATNLECGKPI